ncbi:tRNA (5-methylaminomethyl-2-thiouridine)(34)-methyltransferase MnmD [Parasulfitobacter algicola]|uniref:tRNA (5-methylaminomethyl-2-thiouridine)(34)-methyltransferase MnmD n=1 Tax=Parasulfitobacter algicola TaxID=2614809 RepID=A0ABX2IM76_9RHOB|nr:tRNA (5-methylaminomethyl-2-thiouridine)(34)-methyltransferase MnmD [Sulfitobacter algicola]NSX53987.1 tRNA (5-methylaminomethyl-2-thiouridine)(34)-methyltransferase MnmD [Sulfitobacter algicola]
MNQTADLDWRDGKTPISRRFDDPYFSLENGLAETQHVFLHGNDLPARFRDGFQVAELGFGTGLNFLVAWQAWRAANVQGVLHFTSFEAFPMDSNDMRKALHAFPDLTDLADQMVQALEDDNDLGDARLTVIHGDARRTLADWDGAADAWFLDGFSPAKNPELWQPDLLANVARHTRLGGTAATYTAAGAVRRALQDAGFEVTRTTGYGRKRHMTQAVLA